MNKDAICKFCFEEGNFDDLCCPCDCKGTQKYVHGRCIVKYIIVSKKNECPSCKYKFIDVKENNNNTQNLAGFRWNLFKEDVDYLWNSYLANLFSSRLWATIFFFIGELFTTRDRSRDL